MTIRQPVLLLSAIAALLAGCNTTTTSTVRQDSPPAPTSTTMAGKGNLRKGMTEHEIRSAWGEPESAHTTPEGDRVLVYRFDVRTDQRMVPTDMVKIPAYDPINGQEITVMEPTYSPQNVTVTQTIALQLKDGVLAAWARRLGEQRTFH